MYRDAKRATNKTNNGMLAHSQLLTLWLFGIVSGFTLMISGNTLNFWLAKEAVSLQSIGVFSLILIPYSINFLWSPILDTLTLGWLSKKLGHRAAWICLIQIFLAISLATLSFLNPTDGMMRFAIVSFVVAFLSSAQDAVLGALKSEIIIKTSQGAASGIYIFGYRVGTLLSSSGAIYLSASMSWNNIYQLFAMSIVIYGVILRVVMRRLPVETTSCSTPRVHTMQPSSPIAGSPVLPIHMPPAFSSFIQNILKPVGSLSTVFLIITFLVLFKLPDNFISMMMNPFLIHLGYNELEIASAGKFFGVTGAILGGFAASFVMKKKGILESLLLFGAVHALAHALLVVQEIYGKNVTLLFVTIGLESVTGGMAMAAYIAFIASLCSGKFRATQYAFFSSMMGFSRALFPAFSGYIVVNFGWQYFFTAMTVITLPSLLLLPIISAKLRDHGVCK